MDGEAYLNAMTTVEKTAEHEKSLMVLKLRAEMGADGQSRGYRGGTGEISPVRLNASARGDPEVSDGLHSWRR